MPLSWGGLDSAAGDSTSATLFLNGTTEELLQALDGLTFEAQLSDEEAASSRSIKRILRFRLELLDAQAMFARYRKVENANAIDENSCKPGWKGSACNIIASDLEIELLIDSSDPADKQVLPPQFPGRTPSRGGEGTHVSATAVGKALLSESPSPSPDHPVYKDGAGRRIEAYDAAASNAHLAFFDIGAGAHPYLLAPPSLLDMYDTAYTETGARVFLNAWTSQDISWWDSTHLSDDAGVKVPLYADLRQSRSICNRYTQQAVDTDTFVFHHPDFVVVFPAGDSALVRSRPASAEGQEENQKRNEISAPSTCKNCITVGIAQGWPEELATAAEMLMTQCRKDDCPGDVDRVNLCGAASASNPFLLPGCCTVGYSASHYSPSALHPTSAVGGAADRQAPWLAKSFGGTGDTQSEGLYGAVDAVEYQRIKPDIVAPGINIVSARSDGDPLSHGTNGCRTCMRTLPYEQPPRDTAALVAMSGSKQAAAVVTAAVLMVRQYFESGFYPMGFLGSGNPHRPSAALVRAVVFTGTAHVDRVYNADGSARDISSATQPNFEAGFGRLQLSKVLRIDTLDKHLPGDPNCECLGDNAFFFALDSPKDDWETWRSVRFDADYGTRCAPWDAMPGRKPACNSSFSLQERAPDTTCCQSWCFVSPACRLGESKPYLPGVHVSYDVCKDVEDVVESCPFRDQSLKRSVRTFAMDHSISDDTSPDAFGTYAKLDASLPIGYSLAQNETISYNITILGASTQDPLVITMAFTDPPGDLSRGDVLVNDLDLVVTVIPILAPSRDLVRDDPDRFERNRSMAVTFFGNQQPAGDGHNTAEQVRVVSFGPAEVIVTVHARRVVVGHELRYPPSRQIKKGTPSGGEANGTAAAAADADQQDSEHEATLHPQDQAPDGAEESRGRPACQSFALVITGDLQQLPGSLLSTTTSPQPLTPGICGRNPPPPILPSSSLTAAQILMIIAACGAAGAIIVCVAVMAFIRWRDQRKHDQDREKAPSDVPFKTLVLPASAPRYPDEISKTYEIGGLGYVRSGHAELSAPEEMEADWGNVAGKDTVKHRQLLALKAGHRAQDSLSTQHKVRKMQRLGIGRPSLFKLPFSAVLHKAESGRFTGRLITSGDLFEHATGQEISSVSEQDEAAEQRASERREAADSAFYSAARPRWNKTQDAPPLKQLRFGLKARHAADHLIVKDVNDQVQSMLEAASPEVGGAGEREQSPYWEHPLLGQRASLVLVGASRGRAPSVPCA